MRGGFRIGRLFGIDIRVDWSWLFIFLLVLWNLASVFGELHPDWGPGLQWGIALIAAVLFFASVLAHELAHSLVARARGLPVRNITLFLFGGVSSIQREPPSPGAEFVIAVVGPLTSIVLGSLLVLGAGTTIGPMSETLANPTQAAAQLSPVTTLLAWLGSVNILVGLFNLIPGFPLDGGRILRSILWAITGNLRRATRWASWVGQVVAWLFILGGIAMVFGVRIPIFGTGFISGLWLAFIGWFLNNAASQSYQQLVVQDLLEDVTVERIMRTNPPTVPSNIPISSLVHEYVMRTDDHAFPVTNNGQILGLVTLDDVRSTAREGWDTTPVAEIMTPAADLVTVAPGDDAATALSKLQERDIRQLPVMDHGRLAGLLRRRDIVRWLQLQSEFKR